MSALYFVSEIRKIEETACAALPAGTLMQRAGHAAAEWALELLSAQNQGRILVLAGPGNNGGDAFETAYCLAQAGQDTVVLMLADEARLPIDAQQALLRAQSSTAVFAGPADLPDLMVQPWSLVIDGLLGIGLVRPVTGTLREVISWTNTLSCPVLSLDVPSGLNADTGEIVGPDGEAVRASHTISFIADKPGLRTNFGRDYAGQVQLAALGIAPDFFPAALLQLNEPALFSSRIKQRPHNSHKGSFGDVKVLGGASGMQGAPILTGRAALQCGAGRVHIAFIDGAPAYDTLFPELMCRQADGMEFSSGILVCGPGAGVSGKTHALLSTALNSQQALVLDADALNLIAAEAGLQTTLAKRAAPTLLTPHPLEAARLLSTSAKEIQANRVSAARQLAGKYSAVVILKGSGTVIARPDGVAVINCTGNPALATAGTGDVLAGVCGALLAQHLPPWEAALAAVWLHGEAADQLVAQGLGPIGLTASELIPAIRQVLNRLAQQPAGV